MDEIKIKLPARMSSFGCTSILNEQYVVLFGGDPYYDEIFIFSTKDEKFIKSNVKCPGKGGYRAFTINNKSKNELSVHGFVRDTWKLSEISDHLYPPQYLIMIINKYYWNEWVHVIEIYTGKHFKIDTLDILR